LIRIENKFPGENDLNSNQKRNTTDRVKLSIRPETLDFFNLYEVFKKKVVSFFLQYFIAYGEFRVAVKVL